MPILFYGYKIELLNKWMVQHRSRPRERYSPYGRGGDNRDGGRRFDHHRRDNHHEHGGRRDSRDHRDDRRDSRGNERGGRGGGRDAFLCKFPQDQSEQREPVHVATVPEIMHSMSGMAPDDNLRQIAEAQVEMTQAVLLPAAAKEALDRVMAKQGSINEKELERGHPDPRKLDTLFGQVVNYANHDPLSHELHKMRDEIATSPPLRAAIKDYLKVEVRRPRLERRPCRDRGD